MIRLKNAAELSRIREASRLLAQTLQELAALVRYGIVIQFLRPVERKEG